MLNSIGGSGRPLIPGEPMNIAFGMTPSQYAAAQRQWKAEAAATVAAEAPPVFKGTPDQVTAVITQQFIWGEQQASSPNAGLQQALQALPAVLANTSDSEDQQMIGLAESQLANCHNMAPAYNREHPLDLLAIDDVNAQLAIEIAEQPDGQKHSLSQQIQLPEGDGTLTLTVSPNGDISSARQHHGGFFSHLLGVVDNIITPIVDVAAMIQPELAPLAIGLSVVQAGQDIAKGQDLAGALALAGVVANGAGAIDVSRGISAAQGLQGMVQSAEQGNALQALGSGLGGIGGAAGYNTPAGRAYLGASAAAGSIIAIQGGNPAQALAALTTVAGEAGILQPVTNWIDQAIAGNSLNSNETEIIKALMDGAAQGTRPAPYVWGSQLAQDDEGVASDEPLYDGQPITPEQQLRITQFHDLQQQLAQIDPNNPYTSSLSMPGWIPDQASIDQVQEQIDAVLAAQGQAIQPPLDPLSEYINPSGNLTYPSNNGFIGPPDSAILKPGTLVDRFGNPTGRFLALVGTPFEARSLPYGPNDRPLTTYEVVKPLPIKTGLTAPWFGQLCMGIQYMTDLSIQSLLDEGFLKEVK